MIDGWVRDEGRILTRIVSIDFNTCIFLVGTLILFLLSSDDIRVNTVYLSLSHIALLN